MPGDRDTKMRGNLFPSPKFVEESGGTFHDLLALGKPDQRDPFLGQKGLYRLSLEDISEDGSPNVWAMLDTLRPIGRRCLRLRKSIPKTALKTDRKWAGEMAQWLKALAALPDDLGLILRVFHNHL